MGNRRFIMLFSMASRSWFSKLKHIVVKAHGSQPLKHSVEKNKKKKKTPAVESPTQQEDSHFLQKRASQYIPSVERKEKPPRSSVNTKASDTHFPADLPLPAPRKSKRRPRKIAGKPCSTAAATSTCQPEAIIPHKIEEPELRQLPPILTKAKEAASGNGDGESDTAGRRSASASGVHRIKVRRSSPRVESRKPQCSPKTAAMRESQKKKKKKKKMARLSESLVMIKSSSNPWRDFADSMLEMIVENDIREAKDLEELLACYLSLNSKEYHEVIIKVFEHIWFALTDVRTM